MNLAGRPCGLFYNHPLLKTLRIAPPLLGTVFRRPAWLLNCAFARCRYHRKILMDARAEVTACTNSRAADVIFARFPSRKAAASTRSAPTPSAKAPAAMNSAAFAAFTPPVGINEAFGNGALSERKYFAPPTLPQGKILTRRASWS